MDDIRIKIESLIRLAKRPGTPAEGEAARAAAIRLSIKYGIPCEFAPGAKTPPPPKSPPKSPPKASAPKPDPAPSDDSVFEAWVEALMEYGWTVSQRQDVKHGRRFCFRHPETKSEVRVIYRNTKQDFEAEHVMQPDLVKGYDMSYTSYWTIHMSEMLRHLAYTKAPWFSR